MNQNLEEIVAKFGGSSVADVDLIKHVAKIITGEYDGIVRTGVVLSAPGKRWYVDKDIKITDILIDIYNKARQKEDYQTQLNEVINRFTEITNGLGLETKEVENKSVGNNGVIEYSDYIKNELNWRLSFSEKLDKDKFLALMESVGEFLTTHIFVDYLKKERKDVHLILPEEVGYYVKGNPINARRTDDAIDNLTKAVKNIDGISIMPGCYGVYKDENGEVTPLESWDGSKRFVVGVYRRGGSDITGADFSAAKSQNRTIKVTHQNFTDQPGVAVINPSLKGEDSIVYVKVMSAADARELTDAGFTVLVPQAMEIKEKYDFDVWVRSTFKTDKNGSPIFSKDSELGERIYEFDSDAEGTLITKGPNYKLNQNSEVVGLAYKGKITSIEFRGEKPSRILGGIAAKVEKICLDKYGIEINNHIACSTTLGSIYIDFKYEQGVIGMKESQLILSEAIQETEGEHRIEINEKDINHNRSLLKLVGPGVTNMSNKASVYNALRSEGMGTVYDSVPGDNCLILGFKEPLTQPTFNAERATKILNNIFFKQKNS